MNKLHTSAIEEIKKWFPVYDNFQNKVIIADLDSFIKDRVGIPDIHTAPTRLNQVVLFFVLQGEIQISVDYYPHRLAANNFLMITPVHLFQATSITPNFKAKMLVIDPDFMLQFRPDDLSPSVANFMEIRKHPVTQFSQEEINHVMVYINQIKEKIHLNNHLLQPAVIKVAFLAFFLEVINILLGKRDFTAPHKASSRREEIANQFLTLLLEHCKEEHEVSYYANKLFITPQYLSLVLKDVIGKTANTLIDQAITLEAKLLLRSQGYTVQQVADILNFADQSTFGKFFKKNVGMAPVEYRKKLFSVNLQSGS